MHDVDRKRASVRVMMIGSGEAIHLAPLARAIRSTTLDVELSAHGLKQKDGRGEWVFLDDHEDFDHVIRPKGDLFRMVLEKPKRFSENNSRITSSQHSSKSLKAMRVIGSLTKYLWQAHRDGRRVSSEMNGVQKEADLLHLHSLFDSAALRWLATQQIDRPLVVSCYGSDVLRLSDAALCLLHRVVLDKASAITVTGPEFREILLSKYGRHLAEKVHSTFYNPGTEPYASGDRDSGRAEITTQYSIHPARKIVCVGHNGSPDNQHLPMIQSLASLNITLRERLFVVVPMTYGAAPDYLDAVRESIRAAGLQGAVLDRFLTDDEMLMWRLATDVLLYAPISDAFSASVSQALAAGVNVVLGSWLPYKLRVRAGFKYSEIDHPAEAGEALTRMMDATEEWSGGAGRNRALSRTFFDETKIGSEWVNVYRDVVPR